MVIIFIVFNFIINKLYIANSYIINKAVFCYIEIILMEIKLTYFSRALDQILKLSSILHGLSILSVARLARISFAVTSNWSTTSFSCSVFYVHKTMLALVHRDVLCNGRL